MGVLGGCIETITSNNQQVKYIESEVVVKNYDDQSHQIGVTVKNTSNDKILIDRVFSLDIGENREINFDTSDLVGQNSADISVEATFNGGNIQPVQKSEKIDNEKSFVILIEEGDAMIRVASP